MTDENELERTARAAYEVLRGAHGFGPQWAELGKRDRHVWMDIAIAVLSNAFWGDDERRDAVDGE